MNADVLRDAARARDEFIPVAKARVIEARIEKSPATIAETDSTVRSNQVTRDDYATAFTNLGALDPVYDPEMLAIIFEHSNSLRQNVDSYATNIDGFGHRFDPILDLASADIDHKIAAAMHFDRMRAARAEGLDDEDAPEPTAEDIKKAKAALTKRMRFEESRLKHFFEFCCPETSFVTLRRQTRQDLEVMGNAYWEVLRNNASQIVQFVYVAGFTIRLLPLDLEPVKLKHKVRVSELSFDEVTITKRLRRFVQIVEGRAVFFKEFGDPRIISSLSGVAYPSIEAMMKQEPQALPATELLHFKVHSPRSAYGVPRWVGNLLAVIGSRQSEEVNFNYFENKSVPPLAILVSGGRMNDESVKRVQDYVESNLKGKRNFHKILILEAEPAAGQQSDTNAARMRLQIQPLTAAQQQDALFQNYDERNIDKVGMSFRMPRMLRGDIRDFNRASADAALVFAEVQVFEPERQEFDFIINRKILAAMEVCFWRFTSLAPVIRDPVAMSEIIKNLSNANVLTPEEARELAGDVFNRAFRRINAAWVKQPGAFTIAGIPVQEAGPGEATPPTPAPLDPEDPNFGREGGEIAPTRAPPEGVTARARSPVLDARERKLQKVLREEAARLMHLRDALSATEQKAWTRHMLEAAQAGE